MAVASASFKQKEINATSKRISLKNDGLLQPAIPQSQSVEDQTYLNTLLQQVLDSTLEAERAADSALVFIMESNQRIENLFHRDNSWA